MWHNLETVFQQVSESGPNQVVLRKVTPALDGKYRCEVSADAPTFHTQIVAAWMHVVRTYYIISYNVSR